MSKIPRFAVVTLIHDGEQVQGQIQKVIQSGLAVKVRFTDSQGVRHEVWCPAKDVKVVAR